MGLTAVALIYSPWGKRSGAHMNPAVTLTFLRLGKIARWDAAFYVCAQFAGGLLGVLLSAAVLRDAFTAPPVRYVATLPGTLGAVGAFAAEFVISALADGGDPAGVEQLPPCAVHGVLRGRDGRALHHGGGAAVRHEHESRALICIGVSGRPVAGPLGVLHGAGARHAGGGGLVLGVGTVACAVGCAKLLHTPDQRCIHCGYRPEARGQAAPSAGGALP